MGATLVGLGFAMMLVGSSLLIVRRRRADAA